jgi:hypothetical protein
MAFILIDAWIVGTSPMLQNRATEEALSGKTRSNNPGEPDDPRDIAEKKVYRLPSRQLAMPGAAFARMLREAGGSHKSKGSRKSIKYLVPSAVQVLDELCGLYLEDRKTPLKEFEVYSVPVTIPATKGKIMCHRARFNSWSTKVTLRVNNDILDQQMVRRLMIEGTQQIGLGDWRPEKGGSFGMSDVVEWKIVSSKPPLTVAERHAGGLKPASAEAAE